MHDFVMTRTHFPQGFAQTAKCLVKIHLVKFTYQRSQDKIIKPDNSPLLAKKISPHKLGPVNP